MPKRKQPAGTKGAQIAFNCGLPAAAFDLEYHGDTCDIDKVTASCYALYRCPAHAPGAYSDSKMERWWMRWPAATKLGWSEWKRWDYFDDGAGCWHYAAKPPKAAGAKRWISVSGSALFGLRAARRASGAPMPVSPALLVPRAALPASKPAASKPAASKPAAPSITPTQLDLLDALLRQRDEE